MKYTQEQLDSFSTVQEFHDYFKSIPFDQWCAFDFHSGKKHCARGHLCLNGEEGGTKADRTLTYSLVPHIATVNNGLHVHYKQKSPKARVLAHLQDIILQLKSST